MLGITMARLPQSLKKDLIGHLRPELLLELSLDEGDYSTEDTATENDTATKDEPDQFPRVEAQPSTIDTAQDAESEMECAICHRDLHTYTHTHIHTHTHTHIHTYTHTHTYTCMHTLIA